MGGAAYYGTIPNPGATVSKTFELTGTATFTPTANPVFINLAYSNSVVGGNINAGYTVTPAAFQLGPLAVGDSYNLLQSNGNVVTVTPSAGYTFSIPPQALGPSGLPYTGTAPQGGGTSTYTITGTLTTIQVTVRVIHNLASGVSYTVVASGSGTAPSQTVTGYGTTTLATNFTVGANNGITFTVTRAGSPWCTSSFGGCINASQGASPCFSSYACPSNVPKYAGNLQVAGSTFLSWSAGNIIINSQQGYATGLSNGATVDLTINEN